MPANVHVQPMGERVRRRVVLVGAGHAHLYVLAHARELAADGVEVVIVEPDAFRYSGMATGVLGGAYDPREDCIDPEPIARRAGACLVRTRVVDRDFDARELILAADERHERGDRLAYDLVSFNVGSEVDTRGVDVREDVVSAKPIVALVRLRERLERAFAQGRRLRVAIVGGGPTGCEIAANVDALARRRGGAVEVTVTTGGPRLLCDYSSLASRTMTRVLAERGVAIHHEFRVVRAGDGEVAAADARVLACDVAVLATGLRAPSVIARLGLGDERGLGVGADLRSLRDRDVFGAGDCIRFDPRPLPRAGVFAVRQAPVLLANLKAALNGGRLVPYRPQRRYLLILDVGEGDGLALRGRLHWHGAVSRRLKERIDRKFMRSFEAA